MRVVMAGSRRDVVEHFFGEYAVDAVTDAHLLFQRVEMDVAGPLADGLLNDGLDELDDRGAGEIKLLLQRRGFELAASEARAPWHTARRRDIASSVPK